MGDDARRDQMADVAYTALGFAVLGFQRLQYNRRQFARQLQSDAGNVSKQRAEEINSVADTIDAGLTKLMARAPLPVSEAAAVAQSASRHLREQVLEPWLRSSSTQPGRS
jgi:hypothetical protein